MICPGFLSRLRRILLALCLLMLGQVGQAAAGDVRLAWDASPDASLAGYVLLYGTSSRVYTTSVTLPASATDHEVIGLPSGTYYFAVRAFDVNGAQSGYSNEVRRGTGLELRAGQDLPCALLTDRAGRTVGDDDDGGAGVGADVDAAVSVFDLERGSGCHFVGLLPLVRGLRPGAGKHHLAAA